MVSSTRNELPLSNAPAQLLQPGRGEAGEAGLSEEETVEAFLPHPQQTSSPEPAKRKGGDHRTSVTTCLI